MLLVDMSCVDFQSIAKSGRWHGASLLRAKYTASMKPSHTFTHLTSARLGAIFAQVTSSPLCMVVCLSESQLLLLIKYVIKSNVWGKGTPV